jgi:uncharacterized protein with predicted RNA binding PUA domain
MSYWLRRKVALHLDYIYGPKTSDCWPLDELTYEISKKTGRLKRLYWKGRLLATIRENGSIALTILGAELLCRNAEFKKRYAVTVSKESEGPVSEGKSVFAKHVISCGDLIKPRLDVPILNAEGKVIAVGQALLSSKMLKQFKRGVAVKVREGLKMVRCSKN